jgi:tetratricopeptide (TPR) repeat protein
MAEGTGPREDARPIVVKKNWLTGRLDEAAESLRVRRKILVDLRPQFFRTYVLALDLLRALIKGLGWPVVPVSSWSAKFIEEPVNAVVILLILSAFGAFIYGRVAAWRAPQRTIIISPFELPMTPPTGLPITGKAAANLLKDEIAEILLRARMYAPPDRFSGLPAPRGEKSEQPKDSKPKNSRPEKDSGEGRRKASVELDEGATITSVGIEVEGISLEKIVALYYAIRQDQHRIEGDVLFTVTPALTAPTTGSSSPAAAGASCHLVLRARMPGVKGWESWPEECDEKGLRQATHELAGQIVQDFSPNTMALYFQNEGYPDHALLILRQIATQDPADSDSVLDLADALFRNGDLAGAIDEYREALTINPKEKERVHNGLGSAFYYNDQTAAAESEYREAIYLNKEYVEPRVNLGYLLRMNGDAEGARSEFRKALDIDPNDAYAHDNYGQWLDEDGRIDEAMVEFRQAIHLQPNIPDFHIELGDKLEKKGDFDGAITEYREAVRLKPNSHWAHTDLGNALAENGAMTEALAEHGKALQIKKDLNETFPEAHGNLGFMYEKAGDYQAAILERGLALRLKPGSTWAQCDLGNALLLAREYEAFRSNFQEAIRKAPNEADKGLAHNRFADSLRGEGETQEAIDNYYAAIEDYRETIRSKQDTADAYIGLGFALFDQGKLQEALGAFEEAKRRREDSDSHSGIAMVLEAAGRRPAAISEYRKALKVNPWDSDARRRLGDALEGQGDWDDARRERVDAWAEIRLAVQRRPKDADAHRILGNILDGRGAYDEAVAEYNVALDLRRNDPNPYTIFDRAGTLDTRGEQSRAIEEYRRGINLAPNSEDARFNLGVVLSIEGQHDKAIEEYQQGLRIKPDDIWELTTLGLQKDEKHEYKDAINLHRRAIGISQNFSQNSGIAPNFPEGHRNLCRALAHSGEYEKAVEECETAIAGIPRDAEAHLNLAEALEERRQHCRFCLKYWIEQNIKSEYEAAVDDASAALNLKSSAETHFLLGRAYFGLRDYGKAEQQFDVALQWKSSYPKARYYKGLALCKLGLTGDATSEFEIAHDEDGYLVQPSDCF